MTFRTLLLVALAGAVGFFVSSTFVTDAASPAPSPLPAPQADFEGRGDGVTDDTAAFEKAFEKIASQGGGELRLPPGNFRITRSLAVPTGLLLRGSSRTGTRLTVPSGPDFDLLSFDQVSDITLSDLTLQEESLDAPKASGRAVSINNGSHHIVIERVNVTGFSAAFSTGRAEKEEVHHLVFRDCRTEKGRSYGFDLAHCRAVLLDNISAFHCWLDGIKLRKETRDVTIRGGEASWNGVSRKHNPKSNGNGLDAYAGGDGFLIDGLVTEYNEGASIYIKTGAPEHKGKGQVSNGMISNARSRFNNGTGLDINRSGGDLPRSDQTRTAPLVGDMVVLGGVYESNQRAGIYLRGRNLTVVGPIVKRNQHQGIRIASGGEISIIGALVSANSREKAGQWDGISVEGDQDGVRGVTIRDGAINGIDSQFLVKASDTEGETVHHRSAIRVYQKAKDVRIEGVEMLNWLAKDGPVLRN